MEHEQLEPINLDEVFQAKNARLYNILPKFIMRYLKRVIHQDDLNEFIALAHGKYGADFAKAYLDYARIKVKLVGEENLPKEGDRVIFAGNHSLGGLDGIALMDQLGHRYPDMKFMVNDILMFVSNLRSIFLPINKHGGQAREAVRMIGEAHASDVPIFTFPAGLVSRRRKGEIKDLKWGKNLIVNAVRYRRDVIPLHISGRNSNFFYNLSNWRKRLGIKANIEMLYLVDELWKNHGSTITITAGAPIPYTSFDKTKSQVEWAAAVKEKVYELVNGNLSQGK